MKRLLLLVLIASATFAEVPLALKVTPSTGAIADPVSAAAFRSGNGLGNVNNTSDANKPISTATQTALDLKATVANPSFTGTLIIPLTTSSSVGVIKQGSTPILHNYSASGTSGGNFFAGPNAGNFTLAGTGDQASFNTGFGFGALSNTTTGFQNTVVGYGAANGLTTAYSTTAVGFFALNEVTTNDGNTAIGNYSQKTNASGRNNTSVGEGSMRFRTAGDESDALGHGAGYYDDTGSHNLWLGATTGPTSFSQGITNAMALGWQTANNTSNTGVIGNATQTDFYFGSSAALAKTHAAKGYFTSSGSTGTLILEPTDASTNAQVYIRGTASSGSLDIWRVIRGNSAGGGLLDNGLNIDVFGGFQVRANRLGGSGDPINLLGGPVTVDNLSVKSGSNSKSGTFTLVAGTATVSNTSITTNSVIHVTVKTVGGTRAGNPDIVPTASTGFSATGAVSDTSTYNYWIEENN